MGGVELAFVFDVVELAGAGGGIDEVDLLAFLQEDAVEADVGLDGDNVVINQEALFDGGFVAVFEDLVLKERGGVAGGRGSEANFDGVEVIERAAPDGGLGRGVAAVALIGNDQVEGVDGDVGEFVGVGVVAFLSTALDASRPNRLMLVR